MRTASVVAVVAFAVSTGMRAQETTGGVSGRLTAAALGPVAGAVVTATSPDLLGQRRAVSAADGVFEFSLLPPGRYTLQVSAIGLRPLVVESVTVQLGRIAGLGEFALEPATVELEAVTVVAREGTLDPVRTTVGATLTSDELAALPGVRDYQAAIVILPHVNTSYAGDPPNVGGSTGNENTWYIDGSNVTSTYTAISSTILPYNFVRAVEVKAGGYEAQYGRALGAVVNAITYSGTNDFEIQTFGFYTPNSLRATPKEVAPLPELGGHSLDVGGRASGPVVRDRLWFAAAYNRRVGRVDIEIPGLGTFPDRTSAHIFAGKLTWAAAPRATVELSLFGDPTVAHWIRIDTRAPSFAVLDPANVRARTEAGGLTGSLRVTTAIGTSLMLEAALARSSLRGDARAETAADVGPSYFDVVNRTISGGRPYQKDVSEGRTSALLRANLALGRHALVAGVEYEDARVRLTSWQPGGQEVWRWTPTLWLVYSDLYTSGDFHNRLPTAYVQDSWRPWDRLAVSLGVRWSRQTLHAASGAVAVRFADEWQPRLGASWQLGRRQTHRLFGSYGRFYQQIPQYISGIFFADYRQRTSYYATDPRQAGALPFAVDTSLTTTEARGIALAAQDLSVENFDEFTLGYERLLARGRLTVRGIRRNLRSAFQYGFDSSRPDPWVVGTPGKGDFAFLPPPRREYTALEVAWQGSLGGVDYHLSYVLSRTWGNYPGLYDTDAGVNNPGRKYAFWTPRQAENSTGLLSNDRTHVAKATFAYRPLRPVLLGTSLAVMSGVPMSEAALGLSGDLLFVSPRGTIGRTPTLWDLNLRVAVDLPGRVAGRGRLLVDVMHVGNPREVVAVDPMHYNALDANGQPTQPNPKYLKPLLYQPPMQARVGVEMNF